MLGAPTTAHAQTTPTQAGWTEAQRQAAAELVERGGALPRTPTCGPTCTDLYLSEHRPMPGQSSSQTLHRELRRLRWKTQVWPKLGTALNTVTLAAGTAYLGWKIGSGLNAKWQQLAVPGNQQLNHYGVWNAANTYELKLHDPPTASLGFFQTYIEAPAYPTDEHFQLRNKSYSNILNYMVEDANASCVANVGPETIPGFNAVRFQWNQCYPGAPAPPDTRAPMMARVFVKPADDLANGPVEDFGNQTVTHSSPTPADVPSSTVRARTDTELESGGYPNVVKWIDAHTGGDSQDPTGQLARVPDCRGLTYSQCAAELETAGFTVTPTKVVLGFAGADVTLPADAVVSTTPAKGSQLDPGTQVTVRVNPAPADMPVLVPHPLPGETYVTYVQRLTDAGVLGRVETLTETTMDPLAGPKTVIRTEPTAGTRVAPGTEVVVWANPDSAPPATDPGGGLPGGGADCNAWVRPSLNLAPLRIEVPQVFPFALPWWIADLVGSWLGSPVTPSWDFHFPFSDEPWHVDLALLDSTMPTVRTIVLVLAIAALAWLFVGLAYGQVTTAGKPEDRD